MKKVSSRSRVMIPTWFCAVIGSMLWAGLGAVGCSSDSERSSGDLSSGGGSATDDINDAGASPPSSPDAAPPPSSPDAAPPSGNPTTSGKLDPSFGQGGIASGTLLVWGYTSATVSPSGRFSWCGLVSPNELGRVDLREDGSADTAIGPNGAATIQLPVRFAATDTRPVCEVDDDGRLFVAGSGRPLSGDGLTMLSTSVSGSALAPSPWLSSGGGAMWLSPAYRWAAPVQHFMGSRSFAFPLDGNGVPATNTPYTSPSFSFRAPGPNGTILGQEYSAGTPARLVKLTATGQVDGSFAHVSTSTSKFFDVVQAAPDGTYLVVVGDRDTKTETLHRMSATGAWLDLFAGQPSRLLNTTGTSPRLGIQPDGKILHEESQGLDVVLRRWDAQGGDDAKFANSGRLVLEGDWWLTRTGAIVVADHDPAGSLPRQVSFRVRRYTP